MEVTAPAQPYSHLLERISSTYTHGRLRAVAVVNTHITQSYWQIGKHIVEFEQGGNSKAQYGKGLISQLAKDLHTAHGKAFSRSNLIYARLFYLMYPIGESLTHQLSWTHLIEILKIDDPLERGFYEKQTILEKWSVRDLKRQKETSLFLRLAASRDKEGILKLASQRNLIEHPSDLLRDPYVLEFLKIPESHRISELELETQLCDHLQQFLLELGKGFTFVGRQYRMSLNNTHYRVDLVFYHRILRCFVLIDLKMNDVQHNDIGQMNMYLGYFANEENGEGDNPPIGIILSRNNDELMVEYATYQMSSQLFVQKYQMHLPEREELRLELERSLEAVKRQQLENN